MSFPKCWDQEHFRYGFIHILEFLHIPNEISWECGPNLNMMFRHKCFIYTQHEDNFIQYFYEFCADMKPCVEFSTCGIRLALKKLQFFEYFGFQMPNLY